MTEQFYSNLSTILTALQNSNFSNPELLSILAEKLKKSKIMNQEQFLIDLTRYNQHCQNIEKNTEIDQLVTELVLKNIWNNNLEQLDTLDIIMFYSENEKFKISEPDMRKYFQIVLQNAYTMSMEELSSCIEILLQLSKKDQELYEKFNKWAVVYLLNYAFEE